jgi:TonB-linked SusC/RagA family outer membrane protein
MTNYFTQPRSKKGMRLLLLLLLGWLPFQLHAQTAPSVTGMVRSEKGEPLESITVEARIKGTDSVFNTTSDPKGVFRFNSIPRGNYAFTLSFVGYENTVLTGYTVKPGSTISLVVKMKEKQSDLSQIVVVGYGTQKKVNLTGAVDQVGSEYFEDRPLSNVSRGLQGVIPNLNIKMTDGKPTRSPSYNVRGTTSIGSGGSALVLIDGVPGDPNNINPGDIENISVLKDASSAAIYGARGSFGVVLITTKTPKKNKFQLNYSGNYSINQRTNTPDLVNDGYIWAKNFDEAFASWNDYISHPQTINTQLPFSLPYLDSLKARHDDPSLPKVTIDPATGKYNYYASTDWFSELYRDNVPSYEHSLSMSGGSEKVNFMISGRYYHQDGVFRYNSDDFDRYNLRLKGSVKVTDWLTINSNTDFSSYKYRYPLTSLGGVNAVWRLMAVSAFPVSPLLNPDGTMTIVGAYSVGDFFYEKSNSLIKQNYIRNTIGFNASVIENKLSLKGDFSYMYTNTSEDRKFFPVPYSIQQNQLINGGPNSLSNSTGTENYYVANLYGDYTQKFGKHNFKGLVGWNMELKQYKSMFAQRDGLLVDNLPDFNLATGLNYRLTGGGNEWATVGVFYRLNYDFNNKYLLEFNGRYDGSSKFPQSQQFGFFPSASAGWRISEENFMASSKSWLDNLKLRASYGSLGNGNIDPYTFMENINAGTSSYVMNGSFANYIQQPGVVPGGLTWEKATTFDVGLDAEFMNRRLNVSADWYRRNTTGMITGGQPLPAVFGASVPRGNFADLKTSGWEVSVNWNDQIHTRKPITYGIRLTLADNISYITDFYNPNNLLSTYYTGQRLGEIWGFQTDGFFESVDDIAKHADQSYIVVSNNNKLLPGDLKFRDRNGDNKINNGKNTVQDPGDQFVIGNSSIRFPYGITGNVEWNGISLSAFFQGVGKRDWFPSTEAAYFWGQMNRVYSFLPTFNLDRWTEENPSQDAYFPRYRGYTALQGTRELAVKQTRYLQNASYIRLKNLTVGYSLSRAVLDRLHLSSARIYFTGQNIWTHSPMYKITKNFDPEVIEGSDPEINGSQGDGFSYPMQKSWTVGINVGL